MRTTLLVCCPLMLLLMFQPAVGKAKDNAPPAFTLSSNGSTTVLKISISGGLAMNERKEYELLGDGRFVKTVFTGERSKSREATLAHIEMRDLIAILVEGNLLNWSREEMKRRFEEDLGYAPSGSSDAATVRITFSLESYEGNGAVTKDFTYSWSPALVKYESPGVTLPEVHGLIAFWKQLSSYFDERGHQQ